MTHKFIIYLLSLFLFYSCSDSNSEEINIQEKKSQFNLENDLLDFSNKMEINDTLKVNANLSACTWWEVEENVFIKTNTGINLITFNENDGNDSILKLDTIKYSLSKIDSLSFESYFNFLKTKDVENQEINSCIIRVIYKSDTIIFYSDNLTDHLENISYYTDIKNHLYPSEKIYKPVIVPDTE